MKKDLATKYTKIVNEDIKCTVAPDARYRTNTWKAYYPGSGVHCSIERKPEMAAFL